ncbi:MAG: hypothetical protein NVS3B12_30850 [Acidimicrobiales bacterium]
MATFVTLHEWDGHWHADTDRRDGLFGRQLADRVPLDEHRRAVVVNPQPGLTLAHYVVWEDSVPMLWSGAGHLGQGDTVRVDLRRDVTIG